MNLLLTQQKREVYPRGNLSRTESTAIPLWMPLLLGIAAYWGLQSNFNIYIEDDTWSLSNVWNYTQLGIAKDLVFIEPDAVGYDQYFGLTYSLVMGQFLNILGWTKSNAFLVNSIFVWLTALMWWKILQDLPFSKSVANLTMIFLPIFPPFFFAAHVGRPDAMIVLLISIQLFLFMRKHYFFAALLTGVLFETHAMGVVGLFFLLAYALYERKEIFGNKAHFKSLFWQFLLGGIGGLAYYWMWHHGHFSLEEVSEIIGSKRDMSCPIDNYILTFFIDFDWFTHVWELILLFTAVILFFKKGLYRKNQFLTILLVVLVISTFITRRENRNYLVYIFPVFILLYFYIFEQMNRLRAFSIGLTLTLTLYYGLHYYHHGEYDFERITLEVDEALQQESIPVMGIPDFWFAAKDKDFYPIHDSRNLNGYQLDTFYFIQSQYLEYRIRTYDYVESHILAHYQTEVVAEIPVYGDDKINILKCTRTDMPVPTMEKQHYPGWSEVVQKYFDDTIFKNDNI